MTTYFLLSLLLNDRRRYTADLNSIPFVYSTLIGSDYLLKFICKHHCIWPVAYLVGLYTVGKPLVVPCNPHGNVMTKACIANASVTPADMGISTPYGEAPRETFCHKNVKRRHTYTHTHTHARIHPTHNSCTSPAIAHRYNLQRSCNIKRGSRRLWEMWPLSQGASLKEDTV